MPDPVLIVFRKDDVAQLVEDHQRQADCEGIAVLRCAANREVDEPGPYCPEGFETPKPLPRDYDVRAPELTLDMAETIWTYFDAFQSDGQVLIESNVRGLWFVTQLGRRPFIGLARLHAGVPGVRTLAPKRQGEQNEVPPCVPQRTI